MAKVTLVGHLIWYIDFSSWFLNEVVEKSDEEMNTEGARDVAYKYCKSIVNENLIEKN